MTITIKAQFVNGALTPLEPLDLPEGALVELNVQVTPLAEASAPDAEPEPARADSGGQAAIDFDDPAALKEFLDREDIERYFSVLRQYQDRKREYDRS